MPGRGPDLEALERQLQAHDQRLEVLRPWRGAIEDQLRRCQGVPAPTKRLDGTRDLASLLYERGALDREIRGHEALIALGRDPRALDALQEVATSLRRAREASRDPRAFARARGIELPRNMMVSVEVAGDRVTVQAVYHDQAFSAGLTWAVAGVGEAG